MKNIFSLLFCALTLQSFATIYVIGGGNQNINCAIGDTLRFTSGCQGTNPSSPYELDIYNSTNAVIYSNFPMPIPFDYVIVGGEASWSIAYDDINACSTGGTISVAVGVQEYAAGNAISIWTDPVSSQLMISSDAMPENAKVEIFNAAGELVRAENCHGKQISIGENALPAGIYFVRVMEGEEFLGGKKIPIVYAN